MVNLTPPFSEAQQKFLAICPKITAAPSILAAAYMVQHVARSSSRRKRTYTRIILGMSSMDVIYAIKSFLSTWPLPESSTAFGASGNTATCTAAGFWGQGASLSSVIYNGTLTLYYLLTIRQGWTQRQFQHTEWVLHLLPLTIGWGTAIAGIPLQLYNPIGWTCWIGPWPYGCDSTDTCERGNNSKLYRWAFFHGICWTVFAFVFVAMTLIYQKIFCEERGSNNYRFSHHSKHLSTTGVLSSSSRRQRPPSSHENGRIANPLSSGFQRVPREALSRRFAGQAALFILAFLLAWIWPMAQFAVTNSPSGTLYYPLLAITVILNPLQGLMNALIYFRPRYLRARQRLERKKKRQEQQQQQQNSSSPQDEPQPPEAASEQQSSSQNSHRWLTELFRRGKGSSSGEGSGASDQWQALLSAVSVGGEDDEDDWEAAAEAQQLVPEDTAATRSCSSTKLAMLDS